MIAGRHHLEVPTILRAKMSQPVFPFKYPHSQQVSVPMGGLGAGCIGLNGEGGLIDFSIANRPATTALPDGHDMRPGAFALLQTGRGSKSALKLLEGPFPVAKVYAQGLQSQGYRHGAFEGLPRFAQSSFSAGYPFAKVELTHPDVPLRAFMVGWSPFVPLDDVASGVPCAILEYTLINPTRKSVAFKFSFHLSHLAVGTEGWPLTRNEILPGRGVHFTNEEPVESDSFGSASLTLVGQQPAIKAMWLRGGWFDAVSALWREAETGSFQTNDGREDAGCDGRNGGSVLVRGSLKPGATITIPVVITWHFPNSRQNYGGTAVTGETDCNGGPVTWHPFYTSKWRDAREGRRVCPRTFRFPARPDHRFSECTAAFHAAEGGARCSFSQPSHPQITDDPAPEKRQRLGLGRMFH